MTLAIIALLTVLVVMAYSTIRAIAYSKTDDYKTIVRLDKYSK